MANVTSTAYDADSMTAQEFFAEHPEVGPGTDREVLTAFLPKSLCNKDLASRLLLANLFLDWGADPSVVDSEKSNVLHSMVYRWIDPAREAPLFKRLMELGADPNQRSPRYGWPITIMLVDPHFTEQDLAPVYDALFEHPHLEFLEPAPRSGQTMWDLVWRGQGNNPGVVARTQRYILEHVGVPIPCPHFRRRLPDKSWLLFEDPNAFQDAAGYWHRVKTADTPPADNEPPPPARPTGRYRIAGGTYNSSRGITRPVGVSTI